ncbi:MAG TPA: response regulator [Bacteroidia bacterium]
MPSTDVINILMADDDLDDCHFFERALKKIPIATKLSILHDGEQLMDHLLKNKSKVPNVLFLDINMPRKNGYECLQEIKGNKDLADFPIVMYSTSLKDAMVDMLYEEGAHCYLRKCDFPDLVKYLQLILTMLHGNSLPRTSKAQFVLNETRVT